MPTSQPVAEPARPLLPQGRPHTPFEDVQGIFTGCLFAALALVMFRESTLLTGGTTGLAFLIHYLGGWALGAILFALSVVGIYLNRKNLIVLLMAIELMLLAVNMNFVAFAHYLGDLNGQIFVFFILTVAAAESAIGLAILVLLFRNKSSINVDELNSLKG